VVIVLCLMTKWLRTTSCRSLGRNSCHKHLKSSYSRSIQFIQSLIQHLFNYKFQIFSYKLTCTLNQNLMEQLADSSFDFSIQVCLNFAFCTLFSLKQLADQRGECRKVTFPSNCFPVQGYIKNNMDGVFYYISNTLATFSQPKAQGPSVRACCAHLIMCVFTCPTDCLWG
jgi:hypothetical protein